MWFPCERQIPGGGSKHPAVWAGEQLSLQNLKVNDGGHPANTGSPCAPTKTVNRELAVMRAEEVLGELGEELAGKGIGKIQVCVSRLWNRGGQTLPPPPPSSQLQA